MGSLNDLGVKYRTDKSSLCHDYLDFYEEVFKSAGYNEGYRCRLVEIGVFNGASMKLWRDFFGEGSVIVGIDHIPIGGIAGTVLSTVNAYSNDGLGYISKIQPNILIDDGSHQSSDIIRLVDFVCSSDEILDCLDVFIIEDVHASFLDKYTPPGTKNAFFYCKELFGEMGWNVKIKQRYEDFSDSVTMVALKK